MGYLYADAAAGTEPRTFLLEPAGARGPSQAVRNVQPAPPAACT